MLRVATFYGAFVVFTGGMVLLTLPFSWQTTGWLPYACYVALALFSSRMAVNVPSLSGSLPLFFVFVLFGIMNFSRSEALALGCAAALCQATQRRTGPRNFRYIAFITCNMALTIVIGFAAYHSRLIHDSHLETALQLILAAAVCFALNTFTMAAVTALSERRSLFYIWRTGYFWSFPFYVGAAALAEAMVDVNRNAGWQSGLLVLPVFYLAYRSYAMYRARAEDGKKHAEEMAALHLRTIEALALAIEAKDHTTHDHLRRVQVYAVEMGKELGLSQPELDALRAAALLHDIGKLAIPEHIISKPGKLSQEEFEKMKIHPVVGAEILERVRFPYPVTPIVRSHHEKWNGAGYPDGLKGLEIPIGARILAAVDCLDALASDRQYRRAISLDEAMLKLDSESGASFDPKVIEALKRRCAELERMAVQAGAGSARLSTYVKAETGSEPGNAGGTQKTSSDFLSSIAAARQEVQILFELAQELGNSLSLDETLSLVALRLKRVIPYDSLIFFIPADGSLRAEHVTGDNFKLFSKFQIPFGAGLSGWVAENRKAIINGDPALEPGYVVDEMRFTTMRSALSVPLIGINGLASVLTAYHGDRDAFTPDHLRILQAITPKIALAIENALKYQKAENSAATDYMTGLPNARSLFLHLDAELARCRRSAAPLMVLVCDLNGFKQVNDRFGHLEGNRLLRVVADKLKESCREYDYVARMGGDEFVFVFPGLTLDQLAHKGGRLNAITREAGREVCKVDTLGLSIGHAAHPDDGSDAEHLLSEADRRMYLAKQKEKMHLVEPHGYDFDQLLAR